MNRAELTQYILETYGTEPDRPWARYPSYEVFRQRGSWKWFALAMDIPGAKLGLAGEGAVDIVNLKCDPRMTGTLRTEPGFFPAYHMNKETWITAVLDGSVPAEKLKALLELSYELTRPKPRKKSSKTP